MILALVFALAFVTMFVGAISGGVGLVLRPLLIALGIPAGIIVGTARVSGYVGELPSLYLLHRAGRIDWRASGWLIVPMCLGSAWAAWLALSLDDHWLRRCLGAGLLATGGWLVASPSRGVRPVAGPRLAPVPAWLGTAIIAFVNTLVGGLGPIFAAFYMWAYGTTAIESSALWRVAWYLGTIPAAIAFIRAGTIDWLLCLVLSAGLALGGVCGTWYGLRRGETWVRWIVLALVFASAVKLLV